MQAKALTQIARFHNKVAADPTLAEALQRATNRQLQAQALRDVLGYGGAALGVGAGLRGLTELFRLGARALPTKKRKVLSAPSAIYAQMPVPQADETEEKQSNATDVFREVGDFISGGKAQTREGIPWFTPAAVGVPLAGGIGGWKFMDWLLDKRRKSQIEAEVEAAKVEYEKALAEAQGVKRSSDSELGRTLDRLYDVALEKSGGTMTDLGGSLAGLYLLMVGGAAGLTGTAAYNWTRKRSRQAIIDKALKSLKRKQQMQQPAPILVQPVPTARRANLNPEQAAADSLTELEDQLAGQV